MLEKAIRVAQSLEAADKNAKKLKAEEAASTPIHRNGHYRNARPPAKTKTCYRCGDTDHIATACRFRDAGCKKCHKKGHLARVCKSGSRPPHQIQIPRNILSHEIIKRKLSLLENPTQMILEMYHP